MEKIFSSHLICIKSGSSLKEAKEIMQDKRIRHLPIIDADQNIIAIVTSHDLISREQFQNLPVDFFASSPVAFVHEDTPLSTVALKFIETKMSSVILCDNDMKAIGIITTNDILFQYAQLTQKKEPTFAIDQAKLITTAGEFFRKLADIGI